MVGTFIIDGFGQAFKSHYSHLDLKTSSGIPSGCIYGFLISIRSLKKKYPNFHFTIACDTYAKRKKEAYPEYKATRPSFRLDDPIKDLKDILSCLNISQAEAIGEEADDTMASLAERAPEGQQVFIYSADKDLLQLVKNGKVIVIKPKSGQYPEELYDEEAVNKKYGVFPSEFPCYQAFKGDNIDNVPGVERFPSKIIASLSSKYKTPQNIYASLSQEKLTDFQRHSLIKSESQVHLNYFLVALKKDVEVILSNGISNQLRLEEFLKQYEIKSISAEGLVRAFDDESDFHVRTSPEVENYPLFEEGELV